MSPAELLAAAIALGLPDLIKLIQSLVANAQGQGVSLETLTAAANTAADVAEDAKFPPVLDPGSTT